MEGAGIYPVQMLLFNSGAPTVINQKISFGLGNSALFIKNTAPPAPAEVDSYTQIPINTSQPLSTLLVSDDNGAILAGPVNVPYQVKVTGNTVTNGVSVSGYLAAAYVETSKDSEIIYYYNEDPQTYDYATGEMNVEVLGIGLSVNGPSNFIDTSPLKTSGHQPIIVNEDTFGLYGLNFDFTFTTLGVTYVVVGIWAYPNPVAARMAPFSAEATPEAAPAPTPEPPLDIKALFAETAAKLRARQRR